MLVCSARRGSRIASAHGAPAGEHDVDADGAHQRALARHVRPVTSRKRPLGPIDTSLGTRGPFGSRARPSASRRCAVRPEPARRAGWGRPSPDDRAPATRAPPAPRPARSPRASRARDGRAGGASARAPTTRGGPTGSVSAAAGQPGRQPKSASATPCSSVRSAVRTWSPSSTACAWASGGLCHGCVLTRRTSADQPRSARSPPAPALVASSGVAPTRGAASRASP